MSELFQTLVLDYPNDVLHHYASYDVPVLIIRSESLLDVMNVLYSNDTFGFTFLTDLCGVHYPDTESLSVEHGDLLEKYPELFGINTGLFAVVYHLHNMYTGLRIRVKTFVSLETPIVYSLTGLFASADWMERETYDFFGIEFKGHPNMSRILNMDEMTYFPMRKEYALEDATRTDKLDAFFGRTQGNL